MIRNILFDLDNTLLDFSWAERRALTETLKQLGIPPRESTLQRYSQLNLAQWKLLEQGKISRSQVKLRRYQLLFEELGVNASPAEAAAIYEGLLGQGHRFMEGAPQLLEALYPHYRLYLVTNGTAAVQKGRIASADLAGYFQDIFISEEIGANKPSLEYFQQCFARIPDFFPAETVVVGDSLTSDIQGGKNAGIATVWLNPSGLPRESGPVPDFEIAGLNQLPEVLGKL